VYTLPATFLAQGQPLSPEGPCFPEVPDCLQAWTVQNPSLPIMLVATSSPEG